MLQQIRDLFRDLGGNVPMRVLGDEAVTRGVIPPEEVQRCTARGIAETCRRALKVKTEDGLPFAKPVAGGFDEHGFIPWKQLPLFNYEEAVALLAREAKAVVDDYTELVRLQRWCLDRFGKAPEIPALVEVDPVG